MAKPDITEAMLLADLQAVARRLKIRRLTSTRYLREGSFRWTSSLKRRLGNPIWSEVCQWAGLLPTSRGCRGVDRRPCRRCSKETNWYGPGSDGLCKQCRQTLRRRKTCQGWQEDAA